MLCLAVDPENDHGFKYFHWWHEPQSLNGVLFLISQLYSKGLALVKSTCWHWKNDLRFIWHWPRQWKYYWKRNFLSLIATLQILLGGWQPFVPLSLLETLSKLSQLESKGLAGVKSTCWHWENDRRLTWHWPGQWKYYWKPNLLSLIATLQILLGGCQPFIPLSLLETLLKLSQLENEGGLSGANQLTHVENNDRKTDSTQQLSLIRHKTSWLARFEHSSTMKNEHNEMRILMLGRKKNR
jgi:hypothetical protein